MIILKKKIKYYRLENEPVFSIVLSRPHWYEGEGVWHRFEQGSIVELTYFNGYHSIYADFINKNGDVQSLHPSDYLILN